MSGDDVEMDKLTALQTLDAALNAQMQLMMIFASGHGLDEHPILKRLFSDMGVAHAALVTDIYKRSDEAYRRERLQ